MKIPKYLLKPAEGWVQPEGLRRAVAVLRLHASVMRCEGRAGTAAELRRVADALRKSASHEAGEAVTLGWVDAKGGEA